MSTRYYRRPRITVAWVSVGAVFIVHYRDSWRSFGDFDTAIWYANWIVDRHDHPVAQGARHVATDVD